MRRIGAGEGLLVVSLFALGWTLRWWHLGTPSLWWDELVHVSFATGANAWEVFRQARLGIPPGAGNAGAVPLDYVLLHAWTWLVEQPPVEQYEAYYRFPAYVWSCAALVTLWAWCRAAFGRAVAATAALLLALSLPHLLYTAEARFYALLVLMSVLNLAAFTRVVLHPDRPGAWVAYAACNVVFFLTGLLSLLVLPWQYLTLAILAVRRTAGGGRARRLVLLGSTLLVLVGTLALYYADIDLGARGIRPGAAILRSRALIGRAFDFMAWDDRRQLALYAWGATVAPLWVLRTRPSLFPVVLTMVAVEVASVPVLVELVRTKQYYFHPRHVLFLLPGLEALAAIGLYAPLAWAAAALPGLRGRALNRRVAAALAAVLVLALRLPAVREFLARPHDCFARTKTQRDFRSVARDLRARVRFYGRGEKYLLIVDRIGPGHLANPTLARYLQWYGLDARVVLLGTNDFKSITERLARGCEGSCRGRSGAEVAERLGLTSPFEAPPMKLSLLRVAPEFGSWPGVVREVGLLVYPDSNRWPDLSTAVRWPYVGAFLAEPQPPGAALAAPRAGQ